MSKAHKVVWLSEKATEIVEDAFEAAGGREYTTYSAIVSQALEHFERTGPGIHITVPFPRNGKHSR